MSKSFLVDTTLCTACRGCQVACKQWHDLPAEETVNPACGPLGVPGGQVY